MLQLPTAISLRQYGQSPQVRTQGSRQAEWNLWSQGRRISLSPSSKLSRQMLQSYDICKFSPSRSFSWQLNTSNCKQSRASGVRPGGLFLYDPRLLVWNLKLPKEDPEDQPVETSGSRCPEPTSLKLLPSLISPLYVPLDGLPLCLNKATTNEKGQPLRQGFHYS